MSSWPIQTRLVGESSDDDGSDIHSDTWSYTEVRAALLHIWYLLFVENAYSGVRAIAKWYGTYYLCKSTHIAFCPCLGLQSGTDAGHLGTEQRER